jgi:raffinose/stachyose/melibiose transport system substrate-binding protein
MRWSKQVAGSLATACALVLATAACAPGGSTTGSAPASSSAGSPVSKDVAGAGDVALTVWDQNTDGGIDDAQAKLNAAFEAKYPNVKITRVSRSFSDLKTTLKLALTSKTPPDVVQANQGYPDMGSFVSGGLLRPEDDYATLYGWNTYYPQQLLNLNKFSADGKDWQTGNLYGVSQTGEIVGVYYNRQVLADLKLPVPKTISEFEATLPKIKASGMLPIAYGDVEKSPGIHLYGITQASVAGSQAVNDLVTAKSGAWTDGPSVAAAQKIQDWAKAGYLTEGANGISRDDALADFDAGKAAYHIDGTWQLATVSKALKSKAGFVALGPDGSTTPVTTGGEGLAWAITTGSKHPDVAAAYIDFITNADAAQVLIDTGNLPTVPPADWKPAAGSLEADVADEWKAVNAGSGLVPYLDYSTPTFYDTLSAAVQQLTAEKLTPQKFGEQLQADYGSFVKSK